MKRSLYWGKNTQLKQTNKNSNKENQEKRVKHRQYNMIIVPNEHQGQD